MRTIPTSDIDTFRQQLSSPNVGFDNTVQAIDQKQGLRKIKKNLIISIVSDYTGCGHIRNILPSLYLNAVFGRNADMQIITTPIVITDPEILKRTRTILFQRTMGPMTPGMMHHFKELQKQFKFKMVYDIDDFIWDGPDEGEEIPAYNFGKGGIDNAVQESSIANMKMMDTVCVSTQFLKDYIATRGVDIKKIVVVHNTLPNFLWDRKQKEPITEKIKKPRILWSSSPTHWNDKDKLCGDMDNAWKDWIIKNVKADKIEYIQMGGLPWFFEEIKDKIKVYGWVNSLHYPQAVTKINADFGIAPLVPNYFNYSKSAIKYQEYCMAGVVGIGSVFTNGQPSPYDVAITQAKDNITEDELDKMFFEDLCEPETYNRLIEEQYQQLEDESWITESAGYVNLLTSIL